MHNTSERIALITGASSGIGYETARLFAKGGYVVYCASRRKLIPDVEGELHALSMDLTRQEDIDEGIANILQTHGHIDVLVHCAGNGYYGPLECSTADDMQAQLDVNLFAAQRLVNAVLPGMRERNSGKLLFVGSVGGIFAIPFQSLYSCSKAALAIFVEGLRLELKPFDVHAAIIEPGDVRTGFTNARAPISHDCPDVYLAAMKKAVAQMEHDEQNGMPPLTVAKAILKAAQKKKPPARTVVGFKYKLFVFLKRLLPNPLIEWLLYQMY